MSDENLGRDDFEFNEEADTPPKNNSNRTFLIAAGILGAIALVAAACIAIYALFILPQRRALQTAQLATLSVQNTEVARAITQTSAALQLQATSTPTVTPEPTATATLTPTPVLAIPTSTSEPTLDPRTATVAALLTQAAGGVGDGTAAPPSPTPTALPNTGFADDVGLPAMLGMAAFLVAIIFAARRLRTA